MNEKRYLWFILACVVLAFAWGSRFGAANQAEPKVAKWEFKVTMVDIESKYAPIQGMKDHLQSQFEQGWELVTSTPVEKNGTTMYILMTLKRPKD